MSLEGLSQQAVAVLREEEDWLGRVQASLRSSHRPSSDDGRRSLRLSLEALRDEAAAATPADLPALLQQMTSVRALLERPGAPPRPDADSPYFAHLRVREDSGTTDCFLGRAGYVDAPADVRIVDWRSAALARVFYRYREGDAFEEQLPGRLAQGTVEARRVLVVRDGRLEAVLGDSFAISRTGDGRWREGPEPYRTLGGGAGTAARPATGPADVTALLDRAQYDAMETGSDRALLVVGSAGSGKTTVALHRLAKLRHDDPRHFPCERIRVLVPEEGLCRLWRRLLEPAGAGPVQTGTLAAWSRQAVRSLFRLRDPRICDDTPPLVAQVKRHPLVFERLRARLAPPAKVPQSFPGLRRWLAEIFSDRSFLGALADDCAGELPRTAVEETVRHTMAQLGTPTSQQIEGWDEARTRALDGRPLDEGTPQGVAGTVDAEDLPLLLLARVERGRPPSQNLVHLVLDEAEDLSLAELHALGRLLGGQRCATVAGDEMQQTQPGWAGWDAMLGALGARGARTCRLQVSYRCPRPVAELARRILGPLAPDAAAQAARDGAPTGFFAFPDEPGAQVFLASALRDLSEREPAASVAVVARDAAAARELFPALAEMPDARLVQGGDFTFDPGVDVTDVDAVKGLEFDYVVVPDATAAAYPDTDEARRRLHVAATRATHQLWLLASGSWSPLVADAAREAGG